MNNLEESRLVEKARRDFLLFRIFAGKVNYRDSFIRDPTQRIKRIGSEIYYETLLACTDVLSERDVYVFLISSGQWSEVEQKKLDALPRDIENLKTDLYRSYESPSMRKEIKITISQKKKVYVDLSMRRNKYKNLTKEGISYGIMWTEMIKHMYEGPDYLAALNFYQSSMISEEDIRSIVLDSDFSSYYGASKNVLGRPSVKMTDDQRRLMLWANVYKNVRSNPDCPPDIVFNDHDAFDGWLILENRKSKTTKKIISSSKGIDPKATNVYYATKTKEEHDEIMALNSPEALMKMQKEFKGLGK